MWGVGYRRVGNQKGAQGEAAVFGDATIYVKKAAGRDLLAETMVFGRFFAIILFGCSKP